MKRTIRSIVVGLSSPPKGNMRAGIKVLTRAAVGSVSIWRVVFAVLALTVGPALFARASPHDSFEIADYFRLGRIGEATISPDGTRLVYAVDRRSVEKDATTREVYSTLVSP